MVKKLIEVENWDLKKWPKIGKNYTVQSLKVNKKQKIEAELATSKELRLSIESMYF